MRILDARKSAVLDGGRFMLGLTGLLCLLLLPIPASAATKSSKTHRPHRAKHQKAATAIVPGESVAGIRLGDRARRVRSKLDKPFAISHYGKEAVWRYGQPLLTSFILKRGKVVGITALSKRLKTDRGIGPGASYARTTSAYPEAVCSEGTFGPDSRTCVLESQFKGRTIVTDFVFFDMALSMREVNIAFK